MGLALLSAAVLLGFARLEPPPEAIEAPRSASRMAGDPIVLAALGETALLRSEPLSRAVNPERVEAPLRVMLVPEGFALEPAARASEPGPCARAGGGPVRPRRPRVGKIPRIHEGQAASKPAMKTSIASPRPLIAAGLLLIVSSPMSAIDLDAWAKILERHTRSVSDIAGVRVDYGALKGSAEWRAVVASLSASAPAQLSDRNEKLAFWINAYNILAIDVVVKNHPVASIKDVGSFFTPVWKKPAGQIGGETVTLDRIEHEILRPMGEPRVHAAIVCASLSCPPLRREPYRADRLDEQLDDNVRTWLSDPRKGATLRGRHPAAQLDPRLVRR